MNDDQKLIAFAALFGAPGLSAEEARAFAETVAPNIFTRLLVRAHEHLSTEDRVKATELVEQADVEGLFAFLNERIPDLQDVLERDPL